MPTEDVNQARGTSSSLPENGTIGTAYISTGGGSPGSNVRGQYPWSEIATRRAGENDPKRVDFENSSNSTKVRVSADAYGLGDQGLGTGLVV